VIQKILTEFTDLLHGRLMLLVRFLASPIKFVQDLSKASRKYCASMA
jgi:hypothetical protein